MQNKGAITLFAILFALVSLYQLSFTYVANNIKDDAKTYANGDVKKERAYLDSMSNVGVFNFGIKNYTFNEVQEREINLGLDLKGGMNVTLEVSVVDVIQSLADHSKDEIFTATIKKAKELQKNSQEDFVTLFGKAFNEVAPNGKLASIFATLDLKDKINYNSTNDEVITVLRQEADDAIKNSFNVIRTRIDRFGVSQPNIQTLENGRVLVELPGIKDPERVRKLLQGTAELSFWAVYDNVGDDQEKGVFYYLIEANNRLSEIENAKKVIAEENEETTEVKDTTLEVLADNTVTEETVTDSTKEDNSLLSELENKEINTENDTTVDQSANAPLWNVLMPYIDNQNNPVKGAVAGLSLPKDTAQVNEYLKMEQIKSIFPRKMRFAWSVKTIQLGEEGNTKDFFQLIALKAGRDGRASLEGDVITDARVDYGQNQATAEVTMSMNGEGAGLWKRLTKQNIGHPVAIVLDGYVYSFPNVQSEIANGRSSITGNFTITEAQDLANVLKSGKLPAPARIIEEAIVGPSLGQEAINAGLISFIIAFVIVLLFMMLYYARAGIVANIALIANVFFMFGVLASMGAVLTLPGIAGIVLTIGMSVDANVLIYERIKEELRAGKGMQLAITDGYKNAYSAIIDANVTTLLTGIILYVFGTGPIKGFATTLVIGILTSLFAAIFITRLIFMAWTAKNKVVSFSNKFTENAFQNMHVKFLEKRKIWYAVSGIVIIIGLGSLFTQGLDLGIDFKGGRVYVVRFEEKLNVQEVQQSLKAPFNNSAPEVKVFGEAKQLRISTKYLIDSEEENADDIVEAALFAGLQPFLGADVDFDKFIHDYRMSSQKVGPTIADDIKVAAVWAILFSLLVIFLYILLRFKNWQYGLGALAALMHDVLIVLGIFSIFKSVMPFSMEVDQAFIAAILTVVGYSINDTVVVFDRIREYIGLHPKKDELEVYNSALNSTISRTFITSLSTFIVLLSIFIFGGEVIRGFTFALLIGIIVGTYSSLFIATPVTFDTIKRKEKILDKRKR